MLNVELMFSCVVGKMYTAHQCSERNKKMQLIILDVRLSSDFVSHKLQKRSHFLSHLVHAISCYKFEEVYNTSKGL